MFFFFFFQAEDGIRDGTVTGVQTCALPISKPAPPSTALSDVGTVLRPARSALVGTVWLTRAPATTTKTLASTSTARLTPAAAPVPVTAIQQDLSLPDRALTWSPRRAARRRGHGGGPARSRRSPPASRPPPGRSARPSPAAPRPARSAPGGWRKR